MSREPKAQITLDGVDVNLLRVFCVIVESNGFSAAQARMNISAASISSKMAALEERLGLRLCQRGRAGFGLTSEGQKVYEAATRIFKSHVAFIREVSLLREELTGRLDIGIVDSTVTDPDIGFSDVVRRFSLEHSQVHIVLHVMEPPQIERALLEGKLQIGISAFYHHVPGLQYQPMMSKSHQLYCARGHVLFERAPDRHAGRTSPLPLRNTQPSPQQPRTCERQCHGGCNGHRHGGNGASRTLRPVHRLSACALCRGVDGRRPDAPILPSRFTHKSVFEIAINSEHRLDRITVAFLAQVRPQTR